jgi:hypothetical protein
LCAGALARGDYSSRAYQPASSRAGDIEKKRDEAGSDWQEEHEEELPGAMLQGELFPQPPRMERAEGIGKRRARLDEKRVEEEEWEEGDPAKNEEHGAFDGAIRDGETKGTKGLEEGRKEGDQEGGALERQPTSCGVIGLGRALAFGLELGLLRGRFE